MILKVRRQLDEKEWRKVRRQRDEKDWRKIRRQLKEKNWRDAEVDFNNYCKPSKPTPWEKKLREILEIKQIPFKTNKVIWYTSCNCFTPDLIIGKNLIIEVDGKIHDKEYRKNLDRIRQRALENMGYKVHRVKNEQVRDNPNKIAEEIREKYYQLSENEDKIETITITELEKPSEIKPIPTEFKLDDWVIQLNEELDDDIEKWSIDFIKESFSRLHHELVKNQCAMEKLILLLHGLKLRKREEDNHLDFGYSLKFFEKSLNLLKELFPENDNMTVIHLKNMFNESSPGFFKNLIFHGGPNINPGIIAIKDKDSLNFHIDSFNKYLSQLGITVEPEDIIQECKATIQDFNKEKKLSYDWLIEWMNEYK